MKSTSLENDYKNRRKKYIDQTNLHLSKNVKNTHHGKVQFIRSSSNNKKHILQGYYKKLIII